MMAAKKSSPKSGRQQRRSPKSVSAGSQRASRTPSSARSQRSPKAVSGLRGQRPVALAAGAATAAFVGAIALRSRRRPRKHVLGMPLPRSRRDVRSFVKQIGKASRQAGGTSKDVGKEFQRLGDQAEQFGKALS